MHKKRAADKLSYEPTLDPPDWSSLRDLAHTVIDDMLSHLQHIRQQPVWQPVSCDAKQFFSQSLPESPEDLHRVYNDFQRYVLPFTNGNIHPRFLAWAQGAGTPFAILAEILTATINCSAWGGDQAASYLEAQVLAWCKEMLNYARSASGILTTGGSEANLVGLAVARDSKASINIHETGLRSTPAPLVFYCSDQTHASVEKALHILGIGRQFVRTMATDGDFRLIPRSVEEAICKDKHRHLIPACLVASAGTINTGAFDPLDELADICTRHRVWLHVDAAFGAMARLSSTHYALTAGMERADSLAFDLHKWMHVPYDVGVALIRDSQAHRRTFNVEAPYLAPMTVAFGAGEYWPCHYGPQLARRFRALPVWLTIKHTGVNRLRELIDAKLQQASYLAQRISQEPSLELAAPCPLNIVCFRYVGSRTDTQSLNLTNERIVATLQTNGVFFPSLTRIHGASLIRASVLNHRTTCADLDAFVGEVIRIASGDAL